MPMTLLTGVASQFLGIFSYDLSLSWNVSTYEHGSTLEYLDLVTPRSIPNNPFSVGTFILGASQVTQW